MNRFNRLIERGSQLDQYLSELSQDRDEDEGQCAEKKITQQLTSPSSSSSSSTVFGYIIQVMKTPVQWLNLLFIKRSESLVKENFPLRRMDSNRVGQLISPEGKLTAAFTLTVFTCVFYPRAVLPLSILSIPAAPDIYMSILAVLSQNLLKRFETLNSKSKFLLKAIGRLKVAYIGGALTSGRSPPAFMLNEVVPEPRDEPSLKLREAKLVVFHSLFAIVSAIGAGADEQLKEVDCSQLTLKQLNAMVDHIVNEICFHYVSVTCFENLTAAPSTSLYHLAEAYCKVLYSLCKISLTTLIQSRKISAAIYSLGLLPKSTSLSSSSESLKISSTCTEYIAIRNKISELRSSYETAMYRLWLCEIQLASPNFNPLLAGEIEALNSNMQNYGSKAAALLRGGSLGSLWDDINIPVPDDLLQVYRQLKYLSGGVRVRTYEKDDTSIVSGQSKEKPANVSVANSISTQDKQSVEKLEYETEDMNEEENNRTDEVQEVVDVYVATIPGTDSLVSRTHTTGAVSAIPPEKKLLSELNLYFSLNSASRPERLNVLPEDNDDYIGLEWPRVVERTASPLQNSMKHDQSGQHSFIGSLNLSTHYHEALSVELANALNKSDSEILDEDFVDCTTTSHRDSLEDSFYLIEESNLS